MIDFTRRQRYALVVLLIAFWSGCGIVVWRRLSVPPGLEGATVATAQIRPARQAPDRTGTGREGQLDNLGRTGGVAGVLGEQAGGEVQQGIAVHVCGAVRAPGVYRLPEGARVDDCVKAAGGPAAKAALDAVNLAARVGDGQQVYIPFKPDPARPERAGLSSPPAAPVAPVAPAGPQGPAAVHPSTRVQQVSQDRPAAAVQPGRVSGILGAGGAGGAGGVNCASSADRAVGAGGASRAGRVNINICSVNELEGLPGIGPELARRILETRELRGGFQTIEDLLEVPGIGEKKLEALRSLVSIQ